MGKSRKEIRDHILSKQIQIKRQDIPKGWSVEAADFVNKVSNKLISGQSVTFKDGSAQILIEHLIWNHLINFLMV